LLGLIAALAGLMIVIALPLDSNTVAGSSGQGGSSLIAAASSQNNPLSFNRWSSNGPDSSIELLAIDPSNPNTVYAGGNGLFKSIDGAATWGRINMDLHNIWLRALVIDSNDPNVI